MGCGARVHATEALRPGRRRLSGRATRGRRTIARRRRWEQPAEGRGSCWRRCSSVAARLAPTPHRLPSAAGPPWVVGQRFVAGLEIGCAVAPTDDAAECAARRSATSPKTCRPRRHPCRWPPDPTPVRDAVPPSRRGSPDNSPVGVRSLRGGTRGATPAGVATVDLASSGCHPWASRSSRSSPAAAVVGSRGRRTKSRRVPTLRTRSGERIVRVVPDRVGMDTTAPGPHLTSLRTASAPGGRAGRPCRRAFALTPTAHVAIERRCDRSDDPGPGTAGVARCDRASRSTDPFVDAAQLCTDAALEPSGP